MNPLPQPTEAERKIALQLAQRIVGMARERKGSVFEWSESEVVIDAMRGIAATLAESRVAHEQARNRGGPT